MKVIWVIAKRELSTIGVMFAAGVKLGSTWHRLSRTCVGVQARHCRNLILRKHNCHPEGAGTDAQRWSATEGSAKTRQYCHHTINPATRFRRFWQILHSLSLPQDDIKWPYRYGRSPRGSAATGFPLPADRGRSGRTPRCPVPASSCPP